MVWNISLPGHPHPAKPQKSQKRTPSQPMCPLTPILCKINNFLAPADPQLLFALLARPLGRKHGPGNAQEAILEYFQHTGGNSFWNALNKLAWNHFLLFLASIFEVVAGWCAGPDPIFT